MDSYSGPVEYTRQECSKVNLHAEQIIHTVIHVKGNARAMNAFIYLYVYSVYMYIQTGTPYIHIIYITHTTLGNEDKQHVFAEVNNATFSQMESTRAKITKHLI